ncbi:hypothetical protein KIL84_007285 [Mauremys mutica]|uniref:Uncharacterized protein n=1 Tax=Mauremys mutica TaxID=74926 RepID=A0A9D3X113_9SAUR|nr:hypothetical protein KIL84_007285 [Mauremys mutica]
MSARLSEASGHRVYCGTCLSPHVPSPQTWSHQSKEQGWLTHTQVPDTTLTTCTLHKHQPCKHLTPHKPCTPQPHWLLADAQERGTEQAQWLCNPTSLSYLV